MTYRFALRRSVSAAIVFLSVWTPHVQAQHKVAFVTSVVGNGNLGDSVEWPDNGGLTGIAAADRICQGRALAAGLANPNDFVAWISDSSDDAYCRVHNLTGTIGANCGQPSLPAAAGPWVRTDGAPFAEAIDLTLMPTGLVYRSVNLDEFGAEVGAYDYHFTATNEFGAKLGTACSDWTSTTGTGGVGQSHGTIHKWSAAGYQDCSSQRSLLCLEAGGAGPELEFTWEAGALVFVTSVGGTGDLGSWPEAGSATGLAAGDAICRTLAANAALPEPNTFVAWLSDASVDARDRLTSDGPWVRPDGVMVASSEADLIDSLLDSSIHVTENLEYVVDDVLTGTWYEGTGTAEHCGNWTNGVSGTGESGVSAYAIHTWTANGDQSCADAKRLYCFSNSTTWPFFTDRFESGDLRWWASVVGN